MNLQQHKDKVEDFAKLGTELLQLLKADTRQLDALREELRHGYLKVVVIAEINTGKSTFLNALMGSKVFPSRAVPWTASITILDHADEPRAEIYDKKGKCLKMALSREKPMADLKDVVSKTNADVRDIREVRVWFPNPFTRQGVVLVDTPGVNDPENWREEITIDYLPEADAAIMLFDPMSTWTASEKEFLTEKVMKSNISNFTFVINRKDEVSEADLPKSVNRLRCELEKIMPNPTIRAVSSLNALNAKLEGNSDALHRSGFPELEELLLQRLFHDSAGSLLLSKVQRLQEALSLVDQHIKTRHDALTMDRGQFERQLASSRQSFTEADKLLKQTRKQLDQEEPSVVNALKSEISKALANARGTSTQDESEAQTLLNQATRDSNEALRQKTEKLFVSLKDKYSKITQTQLEGANLDFLKNVNISTSLKTRKEKVMSQEARQAVGLGVGALIGWGIFSFLTGGLGLFASLGALAAAKAGSSIAREIGSGGDSYTTKVDFKGSIASMENDFQKAIPTIAERMVEALGRVCIDRLQERIEQQRQALNAAEKLLDKNQADQQPERDFIAKLRGDHQRVTSDLTTYRQQLEAQLDG